MCVTCGCGVGELRIEGAVEEGSVGARSLVRLRPFNALHAASVGVHFRKSRQPPVSNSDANSGRMVQIEQDILSKNNQYAEENRHYFAQRGILALNLLSSPGSGKTTLLTETIIALRERVQISVIEGDQQTSRDADRIRATGASAIQINTGKGCHLDASMIATALARLNPAQQSVLMIENVGNLVCPASFDLGEAHKVVVLSVTEGEDKPLKYPDMFRAASLMLLNKTDLLPYVQFDVAQCIRHARRVNPQIQIMQISATKGEGMADWLAWIEAGILAAS
jgi:hydrogenase nickel incorporation protein HypB